MTDKSGSEPGVARHPDARPRRLLTGYCVAGAQSPRPTDLVVATRLSDRDGELTLPAAGMIAGALHRAGLQASQGLIVAGGDDTTQAVATDIAPEWTTVAAEPPAGVVLAVAEAATGVGDHARQSVAAAERALRHWPAACRPRTVILAAPRASCAGVVRAIEMVEQALDRFGPPVYVRRQIVHNAHVVASLERRGAVFVEEVDEAPPGARLVFSAHGVAPVVRVAARARDLAVLDATCPLVNKVHAEVRRFASSGHTVVIVGHEDHDEVEGELGEAPGSTVVVSTVEDVQRLAVDDPGRVAYVTQTTLSVDETAQIVTALRARYPAAIGPRASDICYASQNRQDAVKALAASCDLVLVVGSSNSSNTQRLVEIAHDRGTTAQLIEDESAIELSWLKDAAAVGLTAGASAPESVVQRVLAALTALGPTEVEELRTAHERARFKAPPSLPVTA